MSDALSRTISLPGRRQSGRAQTARLHRHRHVTPSKATAIHDHYRTVRNGALISVCVLQNSITDENQLLSGAESQQAEVRVAFGEGQQAEGQQGEGQQAAASDDQQAAAQTNSATIDEITLDDADDSEENRNKRYVKYCYVL